MQRELVFDQEESDRLRDEAISRGYQNAIEAWREAAHEIIRKVAQTRELFTTEAIDFLLSRRGGVITRDMRALGGAMRRAQREGWIEPTQEIRPGAKKCAHSRPKRVWRSLIFH